MELLKHDSSFELVDSLLDDAAETLFALREVVLVGELLQDGERDAAVQMRVQLRLGQRVEEVAGVETQLGRGSVLNRSRDR